MVWGLSLEEGNNEKRMQIMSELGVEIRRIREFKKLSLRTVAACARISPPFLSDIELGRRYPARMTLVRISGGLGVPYEPLRDLMLKDRPTVESLKSNLATLQAAIAELENSVENIGGCFLKMSIIANSENPNMQVALDVLKEMINLGYAETKAALNNGR